MTKKIGKHSPRRSAPHRQAAETALQSRRGGKASKPLSEAEAQRLVHELQVHQIELEMQNEELLRVRAEVERGLARYTELYELAPIGYLTLDREGAVLQSNLAGARVLRVNRSSLVGTRLALHLAPESREAYQHLLENVFEAGVTESCDAMVRAEGVRPKWLHLTATAGDAGKQCRIVATDVTERKRAERMMAMRVALHAAADLLTEKELLEKVLADVASLTGSRRGFCYGVEADERTLSLLARSGPRHQERALSDEVAAAEDSVKQRRPIIRSRATLARAGDDQPQGARELIVPLVRKRHVVAVFGVADSPTDYSTQDVEAAAYLADVGWEIAERKRAERERAELQAQLLQAHKMEAIGTLAGGIAHDFNNILAGLLGGLALLELEQRDRGVASADIREMKALVERGAELTQRLLGFARRGKYDVRPLDLARVVEKTSAIFGRTRRDIVLQLDVAADCRAVLMDHAQLEQVLLNLLVNAGQAMPEGGQVHLDANNAELDADATAPFGAAPGSYVKLAVRDTGVGMDAATRTRIFEPFFTTKPHGHGTGLGLASVYGILKSHGGFIVVESEPNTGTTFTLFLPATDLRPTVERLSQPPLQQGTGKILVVDDEELIVKVCARLLTKMGYTALTATSGREALEQMAQHRGEISLVMLDMVMPGMSGSQTYDALQDVAPGVKVLLCSGHSVEGQAQELLARGCNGFLQKPFDAATLSAKLRELL